MERLLFGRQRINQMKDIHVIETLAFDYIIILQLAEIFMLKFSMQMQYRCNEITTTGEI